MIGLIACCKTKLGRGAAVRNLYTSPLFRLSLAYAEARCERVFVISALLGLIELDLVVFPYELTLAQLPAARRRMWGMDIVRSLEKRYPQGEHAMLLAGELYAAPVMEAARTISPRRPGDGRAHFTFDEPLAGMQIGERLSFLSRAAREAA